MWGVPEFVGDHVCLSWNYMMFVYDWYGCHYSFQYIIVMQGNYFGAMGNNLLQSVYNPKSPGT